MEININRFVLYFVFILTVILLTYSKVNAGWYYSRSDSEAGCDDCSGTVMFQTHFEDLDVTTGTPCGCSDGDESGVTNGTAAISSTQKSDGTNSLYCADGEDYVVYTNTGNALIDLDAGHLIFDLYIDTWVDNADVFGIRPDTNNQIRIEMDGSSGAIDFYLVHETNNDVYPMSCNSNKAEDTWLRLRYDWKQGVEGNDMKLQVWDLTPPDTLNNLEPIEEDNDFDAKTLGEGDLNIGVKDAAAAKVYIDNFSIHSDSIYD